MRYMFMVITLLITTTGIALADSKAVTLLYDGALVEIEATANKGITEIALAAGMIENSLRIKPLGNAAIQRVEILTARQEGRRAKELDSLYEQKNRLEDRLLALTTREEIFKAAAKSQSGKAPRKTKANPEPMQSIRQGTEFAIAQLEAVYTARRKTEADMRRLDAVIAAAKKGGQGGELVARVAITPRNGRIKVRYGLEKVAWTPSYDLRLNGNGNAQLVLMGQLPAAFDGWLLRISPATLADSSAAQAVPAVAGRLAEYRLPTSEEQFGTGVRPSFSFVLTNTANYHLPAGDTALYRNGEYWGKFRFEGISSGRSRKIASGS